MAKAAKSLHPNNAKIAGKPWLSRLFALFSTHYKVIQQAAPFGTACFFGAFVYFSWASISARYFLTLTSLTTQVKTFIASCKSELAGNEGAIRILLSWGSLP